MGTPTYVKPEFSDFEDCVSYAKQFYQNAGGLGSDYEMSEIVGNKPTSSWFTLKINAMRGYGLIEIDNEMWRITKLAEGIIRPRDEGEENSALIEALRSFPIFTSLVDRYYGKGEPGHNFIKNTLESDEKAKPDKSAEWATCFLKAARYAHIFDVPRPTHIPKTEAGHDLSPSTKKSEEASLLTANELQEGWLVYPVPVAKGVARIIVPRDLPRQAWEKMKKLLEAIEPENKNGPGGPS